MELEIHSKKITATNFTVIEHHKPSDQKGASILEIIETFLKHFCKKILIPAQQNNFEMRQIESNTTTTSVQQQQQTPAARI